MPGFGNRNLATSGRLVFAIAVPESKIEKSGGVTIDWSTVPAAGAPVTLIDGTVIATGGKFLRFGTVICKITASGKFGPYASGAVDGRQLLVRGECFIVNQTVVQEEIKGDYLPGGALEGGNFYLARVVNNGSDLTTNPTRTLIEGAFPRLTWTED